MDVPGFFWHARHAFLGASGSMPSATRILRPSVIAITPIRTIRYFAGAVPDHTDETEEISSQDYF